MLPHMVAMRPLGQLLFALGIVSLRLPCVDGDINFPAFVRDPTGDIHHIRFIGKATIDYFSTEYDEFCPDVGAAAIDPPNPRAGVTQRFQHAQRRDDPGYGDLPTYTYLAEDHLDNPFAGEISFGEYTQRVDSVEFVADGDLFPLPHNRTQLCHYALRLTPTNKRPPTSANTAVWYKFKQDIVYGFETEFHFTILHPRQQGETSCVVAGEEGSEWCQGGGADGFAFVIQNAGWKVVGTEVNGMGYGFSNCLAIEFDTWRNPGLGDIKKNHVSVHVPAEPGATNSANHEYEIGYSDDIPDLQEGTHVVQVHYDTKGYYWDSLLQNFEYDMTNERLRDDHYGRYGTGRPGVLTVWLDGTKIITLPVDLVSVVNPDSTRTIQADPPVPPNESAFDEGGSMPGRAWVGFTSSTGYEQWQTVDILSWTFKERVRCPNAGGGDVECRLDSGIMGRRPQGCTWNGTDLCSLDIRNTARTPIMFTALYRFDKPFLPRACQNGVLQWDHMHPYFQGCQRIVRFTHDITALWIHSVDNSRLVTIDESAAVSRHILQKHPMPFKRESRFKYCVAEHPADFTRLQVAECNCEYCVRALDFSAYHAVFYQQTCTARFGILCPCFEVSEMKHDMSDWTFAEPMKFMRLHTCRGCTYDSHCSHFLKVATCENPYQTYYVGNPLSPNILSNGFENLSRDEGRVFDGQLKGDACQCEPNFRPYRGDPEGRSGMCVDAGELDRAMVPDLTRCAEMCAQTAKCSFLTTWPAIGTTNRSCIVYSTCDWVLCMSMTRRKAQECFKATTWRLAPLGMYTDQTGKVQLFPVYPKRTVQTTPTACFECLVRYDDEFCKSQCGTKSYVPYVHWPHGQRCSTCMFAGNRMHEMTALQTEAVKACVGQAIRDGEDPWVTCDSAARKHAGASALDLFNGVATHFLSECPSRPFAESGAVCVPNLHARHNFTWQVLSRMASLDNTVWSTGMECLNGICELVAKDACYFRLAVFELIDNFHEKFLRVLGFGYNRPNFAGYPGERALVLYKSSKQYVVTDPLNFTLENFTLEMWVEVGEAETVTNVALHKDTFADTFWEEHYYSWQVTDGDMETYWSSQLGERGNDELFATLTVDLNQTLYAGSVVIYWKEHAADFKVWGSNDQDYWFLLGSMWGFEVEGEEDATSTFKVFFAARWVRVDMTRAAKTRGPGNGYLQPVFGIREIEILIDDNIARLKQTWVANRWHRPPELIQDGDDTTWWATVPFTREGWILFDFGQVEQRISIVRFLWKYEPERFQVFVGDEPCNGLMPTTHVTTFSGTQVVLDDYIQNYWSGQCLGIWLEQTKDHYGERITGMKELYVYQEAENLAPMSIATDVYPAGPGIDGGWLTNVSKMLDGDPSTYWLCQPFDGTVSVLVDLQVTKSVMSVDIRFAVINGIPYLASKFELSAGISTAELVNYDRVVGYIKQTRRVVIYDDVRFILLRVLQIFSTNPDLRLAIEDIIISARSDNIMERPSATVEASSAWTSCETCYDVWDGFLQPHGAKMAVDGNMSTWWGALYGISPTSTAILDVYFDRPEGINLLVMHWRFPPLEASIFCFDTIGATRSRMVGNIFLNYDFLTYVQMRGTPICQVVRIVASKPVHTIGGENVIGLREVQIYAFDNNYALEKPAVASDNTEAEFAVDVSLSTRWMSTSNAATNFTIDLEEVRNAWGIRLLFPSTLVPKELTVLVSSNGTGLDGVISTWRKHAYYSDNELRDLFVIKDFSARFIMVQLQSTYHETYGFRTIQIFGSPNLAFDAFVQAPIGWNHSGQEVVDGDNTTFWISEPFATEVKFTLDLEFILFVVGGIYLDFKEGFQPVDFDMYVGFNDTENLTIIKSIRGNRDAYVEILDYFDGRYLVLHMFRPSTENGDGLYGIKSFDVIFDPNIAIGKEATASASIDPLEFNEIHGIDGDPKTIWMPHPTDLAPRYEIDLRDDRLMSGFDITWRLPPVSYAIERLDPKTRTWFEAVRFDPPVNYFNVGLHQFHREGFSLSKFVIQVNEIEVHSEGRQLALREVLFYWPSFPGTNYAYRRPYVASQFDIAGNGPDFVLDGQFRGDYWMPAYNITSASFEIDLPFDEVGDILQVGRVRIWWRFPPGNFKVEFWYDQNVPWENVYEDDGTGESQALLFTDFALMRPCQKMRLIVIHNAGDIGIFEIKVYSYYSALPETVEAPAQRFEVSPANMIDLDNASYWMAPPRVENVEVIVDLLRVYLAYDIQLWFGYRSNGFSLYISEDFVTWEEREMTSFSRNAGRMRLEVLGDEFLVRYIKVLIRKPYVDHEDGLYSTSIRDFAVYQFTNLARGKLVNAGSVWEYPTSLVTDGDENTQWISRFDMERATFDVDLGVVYNIAGLRVLFGYAAASFDILASSEYVNTSFSMVWTTSGNRAVDVILPQESPHFQARYLRFVLRNPMTKIYHPDDDGNKERQRFLFSIKEIEVLEHTGGGGAVGLQSIDGSEWLTLTYGLQQPGEWIINSESDKFTKTFEKPFDPEDIGSPQQYVLTFRKLDGRDIVPEGYRLSEVVLYKNGRPYGEPSTMTHLDTRLKYPNTTRLVMGVRSTAHADNNWQNLGLTDPTDGVVHGKTHSPFFEGRIYNVTIFKNALSSEEVRGLFESVAVPGRQEQRCFCQEACPLGENRFFPGVPVPCSGQGACVRDPSALLDEQKGYCVCMAGFTGVACENHCTTLSDFGCCESDDDCPHGIGCNPHTKACRDRET